VARNYKINREDFPVTTPYSENWERGANATPSTTNDIGLELSALRNRLLELADEWDKNAHLDHALATCADELRKAMAPVERSDG
jgi:hypothetical protein